MSDGSQSDDRIRKTAYIEKEHNDYLKDTAKNFSMFVRNKIEEEMKEEGYELPEKE